MSMNIPMDAVNVSFSVEEYISTDKARVTVEINCSFDNNRNQSEVRSEIQEVLDSLLAGDSEWRFLKLNRFTDDSGRERWQALVERRVEEARISTLRANAKAKSRPGLKLSVKDTDYSPTVEEFETLNRTLRARLYTLIGEEIEAVNKAFPGRTFRVGHVNFHTENADPMLEISGAMYAKSSNLRTAAAMPKFYAADASGGGAGDDADADAGGGGIAISKKVKMTATTVLSSVVPVPNSTSVLGETA